MRSERVRFTDGTKDPPRLSTLAVCASARDKDRLLDKKKAGHLNLDVNGKQACYKRSLGFR